MMRALPAAVVWQLHYGQAQAALVRVEPDSVYTGMWRIVWPDGRASDMVNLTRAKDAALLLCQRGPPARDLARLDWRLTPLDSLPGGRRRVKSTKPAHRASRPPAVLNVTRLPISFPGTLQCQHRWSKQHERGS
jgi:hypothetical protein